MQEDAKVTFFKITESGYYKHKSRTEPQFGGTSGLLKDLQKWGIGKQLGLTKTFEASEHSPLPAYLVNASCIDGDWLLTLWNEIESTDGAIASIDGYAAVGNADVKMNEFEAGAIPGFASYFWILPEENLLATVRFQHSGAAHFQMNKYLRGFLSTFSSHVVLAEEENESGEIEVVGYRENARAPVTTFRPRFKSEILRKGGPIEYLQERADRIRKISKKATLLLDQQPKRALWEKMLQQLHLHVPNARPQEVDIKYEINVDGLSEDEFISIVDEFDQEDQDANNYGFQLIGDPKVYWLDSQVVKDTLTIDIERKNGELVDFESLLKALKVHKKSFLAMAAG